MAERITVVHTVGDTVVTDTITGDLKSAQITQHAARVRLKTAGVLRRDGSAKQEPLLVAIYGSVDAIYIGPIEEETT